jgi:hypothetical protein
LGERFIVNVDCRTVVSAVGEGDVGRFSSIRF